MEASITITWTLNVVSVIQFTYTLRTDKKAGRLLNVFFFRITHCGIFCFQLITVFLGSPKIEVQRIIFHEALFTFFDSDHRNKFHIHCRLIFFVNLLCFVLRDITFMFFKAVCTLRPFHDFWLTIRLFKRWTVMYSARHVIKNKMRKAAFFYYFDILDSESFEINQLLATL